jgi:hypothetical protein
LDKHAAHGTVCIYASHEFNTTVLGLNPRDKDGTDRLIVPQHAVDTEGVFIRIETATNPLLNAGHHAGDNA